MPSIFLWYNHVLSGKNEDFAGFNNATEAAEWYSHAKCYF